MRHVPITPIGLVALLLFATAVSAQTVTPFNPNHPAITLHNLHAQANADMVVARMMTFDRNNDGLVATDELPDRMRNLMLGDEGRDGALDRGEIRALATASRPVTATGGGFPGYTVGGEFDLWSPVHVFGALDDLRLPFSTRERALSVVVAFMTSLRAQRGDADRAVLIAQLTGILDDEERDNFRAALERQPVSKAAGSPSPVNLHNGVFVMPFAPQPRVLKN